ncbi:MAG: indolepyruvate oxidoreductase subunit beta [Elusimicrobiaceae bacterium]|nr:indolepyruvate oxidoreductase subunit beta [Elusimicrobiaceae bacterium]
MKKDIILAGVGGQGTIAVAVMIADAAIEQGLNFRQSEVHGMSQRGGAVETQVRLSDKAIHCDLIATGRADLLISLEPLEALRKMNYLSETGTVVTALAPVKNIPDYPAMDTVLDQLRRAGRTVYTIDAEAVAKDAGSTRAQNVAVLGAAADFIGLKPAAIRKGIEKVFAAKGAAVVEMNLRAFDMGREHAAKLEA